MILNKKIIAQAAAGVSIAKIAKAHKISTYAVRQIVFAHRGEIENKAGRPALYAERDAAMLNFYAALTAKTEKMIQDQVANAKARMRTKKGYNRSDVKNAQS